ncbi:DUF805 domain-containing protein [Oceanomicrobium pacificus]|uniref:DUF805 domain-containing protein n=1 Tax=Oceanomicrobium pacificus TaxID=2692916 RepID=A0A6B0TUN9_9RHOB|nr:DUF805 domain-containing protein [Oceanomicrobium pacificus]MXU66519.1 DUF805 domain-containing protein [Oceanomicrobium pacificus]
MQGLSLVQLLTTFEGRINRKQWWVGVLVLFVISACFYMLFGRDGVVPLIVSLLMMAAAFCLHIKRFHDRGKPGWWSLIYLVPVIGFIWIIVECGFLEGDSAPNDYGAVPQA